MQDNTQETAPTSIKYIFNEKRAWAVLEDFLCTNQKNETFFVELIIQHVTSLLSREITLYFVAVADTPELVKVCYQVSLPSVLLDSNWEGTGQRASHLKEPLITLGFVLVGTGTGSLNNTIYVKILN